MKLQINKAAIINNEPIKRMSSSMRKNFPITFYSLLSVMLFLLLITLTQCTQATTEPERLRNNKTLSKTEEKIVSSSGQFGFNLFKEISKTEKDKNVIISPLSVSTAFGMALNGANGETYDQMKYVLGLESLLQNDINKSYQSLDGFLKGIDNKVAFNSANSIWYSDIFSVEKIFLDVNMKYFNAEVTEADFSNPATLNEINDWVNRTTNYKIDKIIEEIDAGVVMYLINAIYFKGTWKYRFDKNSTHDDFFHVTANQTVPCKMMTQKNNFPYFGNTNYEAVKLPYGNGSYNMMILLPRDIDDVENLVEEFSIEELNHIKNNLQARELTLSLPKFKLEYERTMNDDLINLGMNNAFIPGKADFTKITKGGGIYISEVKHKTFIEVNEEGTEAAAVTSIEIELTSTGNYLRIDRPFLFIIYEEDTNTILFIGKIVNPS